MDIDNKESWNVNECLINGIKEVEGRLKIFVMETTGKEFVPRH